MAFTVFPLGAYHDKAGVGNKPASLIGCLANVFNFTSDASYLR